jgi:hypothetical protein
MYVQSGRSLVVGALASAMLAVLLPVATVQAQSAAESLTQTPASVGPIVRGVQACGGGEIYDDGSAENAYSGNPATVTSFQGVMQFTPSAYPASYQTVCVGLVSLAGANLDFQIQVHDDDGAGGSPGTLLGSVPASVTDLPSGLPCNFYEIDISSLGLNIASGSVHIGVQWNPADFPSRFVCADETVETPFQPGFVNFNLGDGWQETQTIFPSYRAQLIRAVASQVQAEPSVPVPAVSGWIAAALAGLVMLVAGRRLVAR